MAIPFRPRAATAARVRGATAASLRGTATVPTTPSPPGFYIDVEQPASTGSGGPNFPTLLVQVAFFSDPLDNVPQWTDLTAVCRNVTITRGRSFELDAVQAGTATFTFNNLDRTLDPTYAAGPYYGLLTSRRRIRFSAVFNGISYPRFDGYVDSWPQIASDPSHHFAETVVTATDLFGWLSTNTLRTVAPGITNDPVWGLTNACVTGGQLSFPVVEACGNRVNTILDLWPLPTSMRQVDAGTTQLAPDTNVSDSETALNYLQRITDSEAGRLFVTHDGAVAFQGRAHWQTDATQLNAQMVLSDQVAPSYASVTIDPADDRYIRNRIVRGRADIQTQFVAQDPASIRMNGALEDSKTDLLTYHYTDFQAQVAWLLAKYAAPGPRFSSVTIKPQRFPDLLFPPVLLCDLGDRLTLAHTLVDVGNALVQATWIEAINESWGPQSCEVTYSLSPVDTTVY